MNACHGLPHCWNKLQYIQGIIIIQQKKIDKKSPKIKEKRKEEKQKSRSPESSVDETIQQSSILWIKF